MFNKQKKKDRTQKANTKLFYQLMEKVGGNKLMPGDVYEFTARFIAVRPGEKKQLIKVKLNRIQSLKKDKSILKRIKGKGNRDSEKTRLH